MKIKKLVIGVLVFCGLAFNATGQEFDLNTLNGSNGYVINGVSTDDSSGRSVNGAGDINGDGIDDIIIGAPYANVNESGAAYVVFGTASGMSSSLDLSSLNGVNGFSLNGASAADSNGISVSFAGDVNGDGVDDIIIGARFADSAGSSYVVFGRTSGFPGSINLSTLNGSNGFIINGSYSGDYLGYSVNAAGDVNGDGVDDIIIGAYGADTNENDDAGITYVVFGNTNGFSSPLDISSLDGSNGFLMNGASVEESSGWSVSAAGDVNNDGIDDIIVGAILSFPDGNFDAGTSYVVFGRTSGFPGSINLSTLNGSNGFIINGSNMDDLLGYSVNAAGDVNGDGVDDIIIGALYGNNHTGSSYVVFGSSTGFSSTFYPSALNGMNGFTINHPQSFSYFGGSVSGAGDVNGDGIDDIIVGASGVGTGMNGNRGASYVVFGSRNGFSSTLDLLSLNGQNGFVVNGITGGDDFGVSVGGAGDVNGDGIDDMIIGATGVDSSTGASYVIYGSDVIFASGFEDN